MAPYIVTLTEQADVQRFAHDMARHSIPVPQIFAEIHVAMITATPEQAAQIRTRTDVLAVEAEQIFHTCRPGQDG